MHDPTKCTGLQKQSLPERLAILLLEKAGGLEARSGDTRLFILGRWLSWLS